MNGQVFQIARAIATDSYKLGHMIQYPEGTELVYSNLTPRANKYSPIPKHLDDGMFVVFGVQGVIQNMIAEWAKTFFMRDKNEVIEEIRELVAPFAGDFEVGIENFSKLWDLGYLPLEIKALPEGTIVPIKTPVMTIKNTHAEFAWLVNYIETPLSADIWKPMTVATIARAYKRLMIDYANKTGVPADFVDWQGHDFSARGLSGVMDQALVGAAHLTQFKGTDSLMAVQYVNHFYNGKSTFVGGSVPATEHSVMTMHGEQDELETFRTLITKTYPTGIVSIVSDSWDYWKVLTEYAPALFYDIMNRQPNDIGQAKVVFRPDSGDPVDIICGTAIFVKDETNVVEVQRAIEKETGRLDIEGTYVLNNELGMYYDAIVSRGMNSWIITTTLIDEPTPEMRGSVEVLWMTFGGTKNEKGYLQLHEKVGLIYGDSITLTRAERILKKLAQKGFSSGSIVFGIGSYSYQMISRDTFGIAMKATAGIVNGEVREIYKDPKTDDGTKKSLRGFIRVDEVDGKIIVSDRQPNDEGGLLQVVFGGVDNFLNITTLAEIRERLTNK